MEIEGCGGEINEYMVGLDVRQRPAGDSPSTDSPVRSQGYELHSLERYYEREAPAAAIRIEPPMGTTNRCSAEAPAGTAIPAAPLVEAPAAPVPPAIRRWPFAAGCAQIPADTCGYRAISLL